MIDVIHNIVYTFLDKKLNPEYLRGFWKVLVTFLKAAMKPVTKKRSGAMKQLHTSYFRQDSVTNNWLNIFMLYFEPKQAMLKFYNKKVS